MKKRFALLLVLSMCFSLAACALPGSINVEISQSAPSVSPSPSPSPTPAVRDAKLKGDWYGYWEMFSCTGDWAEFENYRWDCCAEIDDKDVLALWDVDVDKATGLARLEMSREAGNIRVSGGHFMNNDKGFDQWRVELREDDCGKLLVIRGSYKSEKGGNFSLVTYLRPWGDKWPEDTRPDGYDSFYIEKAEGGKPMPDSFD